jgi:tetratricopeptide (TPR) repeat protein
MGLRSLLECAFETRRGVQIALAEIDRVCARAGGRKRQAFGAALVATANELSSVLRKFDAQRLQQHFGWDARRGVLGLASTRQCHTKITGADIMPKKLAHPTQILNSAIQLHRDGKLEQAALRYVLILKTHPNSFDAMRLLGVLRSGQGRHAEGLNHIRAALKLNSANASALCDLASILSKLSRPEEALASYDKALAIKPDHAEALYNRGNALRDLERPEEALASYDKALAVNPDFALALNNRGNALSDLRRPEEALASYDKALAIQPDYVDAAYNRGSALAGLERPEEALACFDRALAIEPDFALALNDRGKALSELGRPEEALASCDKALAMKPDYVDALYNRGNALRELERPEEALASYDKALAIKPDFALALNDRGNALSDLRRPGEALASCDKALAIKPDYFEALSNRGKALGELERPEEALASYDKALAIEPDRVEVLSNRGEALTDLERLEEALASYDKALAKQPDNVEALHNRGLTALLRGQFLEGWTGYERRWDVKGAPPRKLDASYPEWKGEDIQRKRIIVYEEQGLGDILQFSRFLAGLSSLGASVTFLVRPSLHRLLQPFASTFRLAGEPPEGETFDFQCALLSLPRALGTTLDTIPSAIPYLIAEAPLAANWRRRIGDYGLKIGICWQGKPLTKIDRGRSVPLRCFHPIAILPGVRLISLQKNHGLDQLSDLPSGMGVENLGAEFDSGRDAFIDAAAVISCLDLIVTSDTSIAHLAGALGCPVWVVLKRVPDWRWMLDRSDSSWYPTMKLYRQSVRGVWDGVLERVAEDVASLSGRTGNMSGH